MGILSQQFRGRTGTPQSQKQSRDVQDIAVGAKNDMDVTITFNDGIVAKILGDNGITGWGGLTFQGQGCTITKLEMIK